MAAQRNLAKPHDAHAGNPLNLALEDRLQVAFNGIAYQRLTNRPQHLRHSIVHCVHQSPPPGLYQA